MNYFLGIEVVQLENGIFISKKQYTEIVLRRFGMTDCNVVSTPIATGVKVDQDRSGKQRESEIAGLQTYTDSDYAGDFDNKKSTSGYAFVLNCGAVAWASKKQPIVTLSTKEPEFVAATTCACQLIWMKKILKTIGHEEEECSVMYCDNNSTVKLSRNPVMRS
ncbi:hypothetical protein LIER_20933 [Lithospermum erythrorhizon]|uniref:Reverse transcriptase Ty1/copia-type domain-containing protein n=1 Tax=Lithospermum erythrorhizon TaxID=34254 RepID=A0AAV3QRG0_LITER